MKSKNINDYRSELITLCKTLGRVPNLSEVACHFNFSITTAHIIIGNRGKLTSYLSKWIKIAADGTLGGNVSGPTQDNIPVKTPEDSGKLQTDRKLLKITRQLSDVTQKYKVAMRELNNYEELNRAATQLRTRLPLKIPNVKKKTERTEIIPIFLFSDLHAFERVLPAEVSSRNTYTPEIAARSCRTYFEKGLALVKNHRQDTRVDHAVIAILGDMISGQIHLDQQFNAIGSPIEESIWVRDLLRREIDFVLEYGGFKTITIVCSIGNHARITQEKLASSIVPTSYETLIYRTLKDNYAKDKRVQLHIAKGYFETMNILGKIYRFSHGDWLPGGYSSVSIARSIAAWNKSSHADYDLMGHTHTARFGGNWITNGSVLGYSPYAVKIKAEFERPTQVIAWLSSEGIRDISLIFVR